MPSSWHTHIEALLENFCSQVRFAGMNHMLFEAPDWDSASEAMFALYISGIDYEVIDLPADRFMLRVQRIAGALALAA